MAQFFIKNDQIDRETGKATVTGTDHNHLRNVLRTRIGEIVRITDEDGVSFRAEVTGYGASESYLKILEKESEERELPLSVVLFQGLPKGDKMDWIVQKTVELGVSEIVPVEMKRSVVRYDEKKKQARRNHWQEIAKSASEQSGRNRVPLIGTVSSFSEAMKRAEMLDILLLPYEKAENPEETARILRSLPKSGSVGFFIGPEGGFEEAEAEELERIGAKPVTLGKRILRTETAGLYLLSVIDYLTEFGDLK